MKQKKSAKQIDLSAITRAVLQKKLYRRLRGYRSVLPAQMGSHKQK